MRNHHEHMYDLCKQYMHAYVQANLSDGTIVDGIVTGLDDENVYLAVPHHSAPLGRDELHHIANEGQFGGESANFSRYGYGYGAPYYGYPRPRPFQRVVIPLIALTALTLLPWY